MSMYTNIFPNATIHDSMNLKQMYTYLEYVK